MGLNMESSTTKYQAPEVKILGSVVELTLGAAGGNGDGYLPGKKPKKNKAST